MTEDWDARADAAANAVTGRYVHRVWGLPGTRAGYTAWPPARAQRLHLDWVYWWQAHLLDCLLDAQSRAPDPRRRALVHRLVRTVWLRNGLRWRNANYDDIAWLGLALQRADAIAGTRTARAQRLILDALHRAWTPATGGGIWWRRGDDLKNAPANGPAAIMQARAGRTGRAQSTVDWMRAVLVDPATGLVADGIRAGSGELLRHYYTYCQGVYLGACLELGDRDAVRSTVAAVAEHCATDGVLHGGEGDGGLFAGILARYLALAATRLGDGPARELVLSSAVTCWRTAGEWHGGPLFSPRWRHPAPAVAGLAGHPARELSVQLSGWMLLEAAATLDR